MQEQRYISGTASLAGELATIHGGLIASGTSETILPDLPDPACPMRALEHMLDYGIGDFGRYQRLIGALSLDRAGKAIDLLERILRRNAAFSREYEGFGEVAAALDRLSAWRITSSAPLIEALIRQDSFGAGGRAAALRFFAAVEWRNAVDLAGEALDAGDARERAAAARCLGALHGLPQARARTGQLADALTDSSARVREEACSALARFGDSRALSGLRQRLQKAPTPETIDAVAVLGTADDRVHIARLHDHPEPALRAAVARALGESGDDRYRRLLTRMTRDPAAEVAREAELSLEDLEELAA